ncbi:hypothetical protein [Erythrobacter sp. CCH5-A1]|jgi:hypothetical protein|uniref:hypothetical protein n=1 Tax=Erythrobacter sp. CCH5-A1 TaxID=1768792 RepID=UPI000B034187|nr:hypothetical protein [Erythrobacter sp. CCH5-A1]
MAHNHTPLPGRLTPKTVQTSDEQVDYSYDQWRQAQMRQMERSYAQMTAGTPAAA